jgi:RES domain-containing protein
MTVVHPALAVREVRWQPCYRIISSRFPPIHLFERVSSPEDWEALYWLESLTNPRLRDEVGEIELVPREDRVFGPGTSVIMAAFTHLNPEGSRFADDTFGAFYAAASLDTSIAETRYHREVFLRATREGPLELDMRTYLCDVSATFHDIRGLREEMPDIYDPISYVASQNLARSLKKAGSNGVVYDSVRHAGGECLAVYRPRLVQNCRQGTHLRYVWDGERISRVYSLRVMDD